MCLVHVRAVPVRVLLSCVHVSVLVYHIDASMKTLARLKGDVWLSAMPGSVSHLLIADCNSNSRVCVCVCGVDICLYPVSSSMVC